MIKQQIVISIPSGDDKGGSKALKTASTMKGVTSVEIVRERNHLVVTGLGVDSVELARSLRKIFRSADIVSVTDLFSDYGKTSREEAFFRQDDYRHQIQMFQNYVPTPTHSYHQPPYNYYNYTAVAVQDSDPPPCSIM